MSKVRQLECVMARGREQQRSSRKRLSFTILSEKVLPKTRREVIERPLGSGVQKQENLGRGSGPNRTSDVQRTSLRPEIEASGDKQKAAGKRQRACRNREEVAAPLTDRLRHRSQKKEAGIVSHRFLQPE